MRIQFKIILELVDDSFAYDWDFETANKLALEYIQSKFNDDDFKNFKEVRIAEKFVDSLGWFSLLI